MVYTLESWPWGAPLCRITECAKDISIGVSVFTLTALAADRYCAIVNPLRKLQVGARLFFGINSNFRRKERGKIDDKRSGQRRAAIATANVLQRLHFPQSAGLYVNDS